MTQESSRPFRRWNDLDPWLVQTTVYEGDKHPRIGKKFLETFGHLYLKMYVCLNRLTPRHVEQVLGRVVKWMG